MSKKGTLYLFHIVTIKDFDYCSLYPSLKPQSKTCSPLPPPSPTLGYINNNKNLHSLPNKPTVGLQGSQPRPRPKECSDLLLVEIIEEPLKYSYEQSFWHLIIF